MSLPPLSPRPDQPLCRWHGNQQVPRVAFGVTAYWPLADGHVLICPMCDMGAPHAGPPVMLDYLKRGHQ